jgi:hypothetical protein
MISIETRRCRVRYLKWLFNDLEETHLNRKVYIKLHNHFKHRQVSIVKSSCERQVRREKAKKQTRNEFRPFRVLLQLKRKILTTILPLPHTPNRWVRCLVRPVRES